MSQEQSDEQILRHFKPFDPLPADFNPLTATEKSLHAHGLPHRPNAKTQPRLYELWHRTLSHPVKLTRAELSVDHSRPTLLTDSLVDKWAGAQVNASDLAIDPRSEPIKMVYAEWVVPTFAPVPGLPAGTSVGSWIGLGGDGKNDSSNLIQAGTSVVWNGRNFFYVAWTQWVPWQTHAVQVGNFPFVEGDKVSVAVTMTQPGRAIINFQKMDSNFATSVPISAPKFPNDGTSAEWVMEGNGTILPQWGSQVFINCVATTMHREIDLSNAVIDSIYSANGDRRLATGKILSPTSVSVIWENGGP
jgi:hypothetical protein